MPLEIRKTCDPDKSLRLGISDILEQAVSAPDYFNSRTLTKR